MLDLPVYIQTKDEHDFASLQHQSNITFLPPQFFVNEEQFKQLPADHSLIVLDDFQLPPSKKSDFLHVINYYLRHHNCILFLIVHNIYSNGLLNQILISPHLFLAYSNLGFYIIK